MADPIKEFLVSLGFKVDHESLKKFNESIAASEKSARNFAIAVGAMAVAIEEAIRRTAHQFENLYYLSQQTGVSVKNLQAIRFAFTQIGLTAEDAAAALTTFAVGLRDNPGLRILANQIVPGFRDAAGFIEGAAQRYQNIIRQFGENSAQAVAFRRTLEIFGLSAEQIRQIALNLRTAREEAAFTRQAFRRFGIDSDDAAKKGAIYSRELRRVWLLFGVAIDAFIVKTFPTLSGLLRSFSDWLASEGAKKVNEWAKAFGDWIKNKDNIQEIKDKFVTVGDILVVVGQAISALANGIVELNKHLGATATLLTVIFGAVAARMAIAGLIGGIFKLFGATALGLGAGAAAVTGGTAGLLSKIPGLLRGVVGVGGIAAALAVIFGIPDSSLNEEQKKHREDLFDVIRNSVRGLFGLPAKFGKQGAAAGGTPKQLAQNTYEAISQAEGTFGEGGIDYNKVYGGGTANLTNMTIADVQKLQEQMIAQTGHSPVGAFQVVKNTLADAVRALGLDANTKFTPDVQRRIADWIKATQGFTAWEGFKTHPEQLRRAQQFDAAAAAPADTGGLRRAQQMAATTGRGVDKWLSEHYNELPFGGAKGDPNWRKALDLTGKFPEGTDATSYGPGSPLGRAPPLGTEGGRNVNVDSDHKVEINVHGVQDPQGTAKAVRDVQEREQALHIRNLRTAIA